MDGNTMENFKMTSHTDMVYTRGIIPWNLKVSGEMVGSIKEYWHYVINLNMMENGLVKEVVILISKVEIGFGVKKKGMA